MTLFKSLLIGGFACSTHYSRPRRRLDQLAATGHDRFATADYARLRELGIYTVREGIRWHRIEMTTVPARTVCGARATYEPLARELRRQSVLFQKEQGVYIQLARYV
jgi:hypothetical protein